MVARMNTEQCTLKRQEVQNGDALKRYDGKVLEPCALKRQEVQVGCALKG